MDNFYLCFNDSGIILILFPCKNNFYSYFIWVKKPTGIYSIPFFYKFNYLKFGIFSDQGRVNPAFYERSSYISPLS